MSNVPHQTVCSRFVTRITVGCHRALEKRVKVSKYSISNTWLYIHQLRCLKVLMMTFKSMKSPPGSLSVQGPHVCE